MIVLTLARKPIAESSCSRNVLTHGTGALNIEETRIRWQGDKPSQDEWNRMGSSGVAGAHGFAGQFNQGLKDAYAAGLVPVPSGRWPANVLFEHLPECKSMGGVKVEASSQPNPKGAIRRSGVHADAGGHQTVGRWQPVSGYGDEEGNEVIEGWECVPGCPVSELDDQSGVSGTANIQRTGQPRVRVPDSDYRRNTSTSFAMQPGKGHGDMGGASRFFKQVKL